MRRLIYSLLFELDCDQLTELVAPLDARGQSPHCRPEPPKERVIDLRPSDLLRFKDRTYRIRSVQAYREHWLDEQAAAEWNNGDGYLLNKVY